MSGVRRRVGVSKASRSPRIGSRSTPVHLLAMQYLWRRVYGGTGPRKQTRQAARRRDRIRLATQVPLETLPAQRAAPSSTLGIRSIEECCNKFRIVARTIEFSDYIWQQLPGYPNRASLSGAIFGVFHSRTVSLRFA